MASIFFGNVPFTATEADLSDFVLDAAKIAPIRVRVVKDKITGQKKGFAFVEVDSGDVDRVLQLNGRDFKGRRLRVNPAQELKDLKR